MRKLLEIGGLVAGVVLIAFGAGAIVMSVNGRHTVASSLKQEHIVGTPDMNKTTIAEEAKRAGLPSSTPLPTADIAGKAITTGTLAREFAQYMRVHTLESTGGLTYSEMGRYQAKAGTPAKFTDGQGGTNDIQYAAMNPKTMQPVDNAKRDIWVTSTALQTALNTSFMADQLGLFGIVVGIALLLSGFGFAILAVGGALRNGDKLFAFALPKTKAQKTPAVPVA